jgi:hypothetical protein
MFRAHFTALIVQVQCLKGSLVQLRIVIKVCKYRSHLRSYKCQVIIRDGRKSKHTKWGNAQWNQNHAKFGQYLLPNT